MSDPSNPINLDPDDQEANREPHLMIFNDNEVEEPPHSAGLVDAGKLKSGWSYLKTTPALPNGETLTVGDSVEMKPSPGVIALNKRRKVHKLTTLDEASGGDLLRIKDIIQNNRTGQVMLRGFRFRRTKHLSGCFEWKLNEVVMVVYTKDNDIRCPLIQGLVEVEINDVKKKRDLILTDTEYPEFSCRNKTQPAGMSTQEFRQHLFDNGRLVCRFVYIMVRNKLRKSYEGEIRGILPNETDFRRQHVVDAGDAENIPAILTVDGVMIKREDSSSAAPRVATAQATKARTYTFGDAFCGAGGASRGAQDAGLRVLFGIEMGELPAEAYSANFPHARMFQMSTHHFLDEDPASYQHLVGLDVLHLSPPCQFFSPAHTKASDNDQANFEAIFTVAPIINKLKPRVVTLEETFGLLDFKDHSMVFRLLLNELIKLGYNVRYKKTDFLAYGLAQSRRRLLIIAARKNIPLPEFPEPLYGDAPLRPIRTVWDCIAPLMARSQEEINADVYSNISGKIELNKDVYDPKVSQLKGCITSGGGVNNYYWDGKRTFSVRELAALQTFPPDHQFRGNNEQARLQVGNAFPPLIAAEMFRHIRLTLQAFDQGLVELGDDLKTVLIFEDNSVSKRGTVVNPDLRARRAAGEFGGHGQAASVSTPRLMPPPPPRRRNLPPALPPAATAANPVNQDDIHPRAPSSTTSVIEIGSQSSARTGENADRPIGVPSSSENAPSESLDTQSTDLETFDSQENAEHPVAAVHKDVISISSGSAQTEASTASDSNEHEPLNRAEDEVPASIDDSSFGLPTQEDDEELVSVDGFHNGFDDDAQEPENVPDDDGNSGEANAADEEASTPAEDNASQQQDSAPEEPAVSVQGSTARSDARHEPHLIPAARPEHRNPDRIFFADSDDEVSLTSSRCTLRSRPAIKRNRALAQVKTGTKEIINLISSDEDAAPKKTRTRRKKQTAPSTARPQEPPAQSAPPKRKRKGPPPPLVGRNLTQAEHEVLRRENSESISPLTPENMGTVTKKPRQEVVSEWFEGQENSGEPENMDENE